MVDRLAALSRAHGTAQRRLAEALARLVATAYRQSVDPTKLQDSAVDSWLASMIPLVQVFRDRSEALSIVYYDGVRELTDAGGRAPRVNGDTLVPEQIETALRVTGVIEVVEALKRGETPEKALERGQTAAEGAAQRQALSGGRSYLDRVYTADSTRLAWYRVTQEGCCSWCAMQASRGAVFREDSWDDSDARFTGEGDVKGHDNCRCTKGFVTLGSKSPDFNESMRSMWNTTTKGLSGREARNAFRRAYEANLARP